MFFGIFVVFILVSSLDVCSASISLFCFSLSLLACSLCLTSCPCLYCCTTMHILRNWWPLFLLPGNSKNSNSESVFPHDKLYLFNSSTCNITWSSNCIVWSFAVLNFLVPTSLKEPEQYMTICGILQAEASIIVVENAAYDSALLTTKNP